MNAFGFDDALRAAAMQLDPRFAPSKDELDRRARKAQEQRQDILRIARAWSDFEASPDGKRAMEQLLDQTVRRIVFHVTPGATAEQIALSGAFREGQNQIMTEILKLIAVGRGDLVSNETTQKGE
jgi:hypothetical protein